MKRLLCIILMILASGFTTSACVESPTTTVVSFPGVGSCKNISGGVPVLVRIIFMAESGQTSDFMPDVFSISAFTTDEGSRIGTFSRLDTLVGGVGNPLTMNPSELTIPVFDVFYWPPEVTSPTEFYFDTRPFIISNLDAYDCEVQP